MKKPEDLSIKIFADGADIKDIQRLALNPLIKGFTTNPTLMRKANVTNYADFARKAIEVIGGRPISFEVFADDEAGMDRQARLIAGWGSNVYVKIPVTNTQGISMAPLVRRLADAGIQVNVTAILSATQIEDICDAVSADVPSYVSIFAGRIADTGRDPEPMVVRARELLAGKPAAEIIWASPRELLNVFQAEQVGCHVITATSDILAKLALVGKDLDDYSLDTVKMFYSDAMNAGYNIE